MRVVRTVRPPDEWEALCATDPRATLYLHPRWMRALVRAYPGYRPEFLIADGGGPALGILPLVRARRFGLEQVLSLPFGEHGGPLAAPGSAGEAGDLLVREFIDRAAGPRTLRFEMTLFDPPGRLRTALLEHGRSTLQEFRTHVVDLTGGAGTVRAAYHRNAGRSLRSADAAKVTVDRETNREGLEALHRLHAEQARSWAGIPPHPAAAILAVAAEFGEDARLYTARREGRVLASCLCLEHERREVHPWVSGATSESREVGAFHAVIDAALADAADRGLRVWHFGGSGGSPTIESFKESFGARPAPLLRVFHIAGWARGLRKRPAWDRASGAIEA